ncbi:sulfatase [Planctomycetales bacterium ZRK34]|nr:sulfatase [Planctomycetales bacterium ZRK34]
MTNGKGMLCAAMVLLSLCGGLIQAGERPNIMVVISDDQSWWTTSAAGCEAISTPAFDRVAQQGVMLNYGYCFAPQCAPARATLLTGRPIWQLEEGAVQRSHLPAKFTCYTNLFKQAGYHVGCAVKGWGPGKLGDRKQNPAGKQYKDFSRFLKARKSGQPFCFWVGSRNPHRPFNQGHDGTVDIDKIQVPGYLPDVPEVRSELAGYLREIVQFDRELADLMQQLEETGEADNTIVIVTSDNGMPFPRGKCNCYDAGVRVPLAIRWPAKVKPGRTVDDFVSFPDIAPTLLEAAGIQTPDDMVGRSFMNVLTADGSGQIDKTRDAVIYGRERHMVTRPQRTGYPIRAIRTHDYLYLWNCRPKRSPTGRPYGIADVGPTEAGDYMLAHRERSSVAPLFELCYVERPEFELYDIRKDPDQIHNIIDDPASAQVAQRLNQRLMDYLHKTGDPRVGPDGDVFDRYPFWLTKREK